MPEIYGTQEPGSQEILTFGGKFYLWNKEIPNEMEEN